MALVIRTSAIKDVSGRDQIVITGVVARIVTPFIILRCTSGDKTIRRVSINHHSIKVIKLLIYLIKTLSERICFISPIFVQQIYEILLSAFTAVLSVILNIPVFFEPT